MGNQKSFQVVLIGICLVCALAGMLVFALGNKAKQTGEGGPAIVIWGTEDEKTVNDVMGSMNSGFGHYVNAIYVHKDIDTFDQDLLLALADGKGPDVIALPLEKLVEYQQRLVTIPFKSYTERSFQDNFIQEGELFRKNLGYLALPFTVDPLVMYWNRDLLTTHNITTPPTTWDQVLSLVPTLTDVTTTLQVNKSAVSLGGYSNITNAREIFAALFLQSGSTITSPGLDVQTQKDILNSNFSSTAADKSLPAVKSALDFYAQFGNPTSKEYTWNPSLPDSFNEFISNDLSLYFGFGSEARAISLKNPNLNFDMAAFPQSKDASLPITYGKLTGLAILSSSKNIQGSFSVINKLTKDEFIQKYVAATGQTPATRTLLAKPPSDAYSPILYKSGLYSKSFLDPAPAKTNKIFQEMVESALSQKSTTGDIVQNASRQFDLLIQNANRSSSGE